MNKRLSHISAVVRYYMRTDGSAQSAAIRDMLTDIMHLCDTSSVDFKERIEAASRIFEEEKKANEANKSFKCKRCGGLRLIFSTKEGTSKPCPDCEHKYVKAPERRRTH
jgi:DNA-directed RNA polymerase subunit RPC12/RpoP